MIELAKILDIPQFQIYIFATLALLAFCVQYYLFIHLDFSIKKYSIAICIAYLLSRVLVIWLMKDIDNKIIINLRQILNMFLLVNLPMSCIMILFRRLVFYIRDFRFNSLLKKCHDKADEKKLRSLGKVTRVNFRRNNLEKAQVEQLRSIYRSTKNDSNIALETRVAYGKAIISIGLSNITLPRMYDINIDKLSNKNDVLNVAKGALNEAKLIVDIAPNACVFSCRKYAENLAKYLVKHNNIEASEGEDLENFSTILYLLNKSDVFNNKSIKQSFYHIKEVGNDAAHGQLCDKKAARDIFEDSMNIEQWFKISYKEIA